MMFKVNVLGTEYEVLLRKRSEDKTLEAGANGYTDRSVKKIVIEYGEDDDKKGDDVPVGRVEDIVSFRKDVLRHEIIHAFVYESGLTSSSSQWCEDEEFVEWVALQIKKMSRCMADAERKLEAEYS